MKFFITFVNVSKGHSYKNGFKDFKFQCLMIDCVLARLTYENTVLLTFQDLFWPIIVD